ncbi:M48 family metalloprotease [bacterium]|nr:M48 family metalloprotease [bacterium]
MRPLFCFALSLALLLGGCASTKVQDVTTNHREQLQDDDEAGLWAQMDRIEALLKDAPERVSNPELQAYLDELKCRIAPDLCADLRLYVMRSASFNAFMTPSGVMVVYTGLLLRCEDEAQLASVIGHEIAHYRRRHTLENWRKAKNTSGWLTVIGMLGSGTAAGAVATIGAYVNLASFSREQEREADVLGFQSIVKLDYAAQAPSAIWRNVLAEERLNPKPFLSGLFASHPAPPERERYLQEMALAPELERAKNRGIAPFAKAVLPHRQTWLDDELARRAYRQSEVLFARLAKLDYGQNQIAMAQAELYRKRDQVGDLDRAISAYQRVTRSAEAPPLAFRDLGLALRKQGRLPAANAAFTEYLKRSPAASDAAMIRSYLNAN